ncbi:hypothetical protein [Streptomyces ipomoeae]|uniref:hypothetical protein n=1 Tax=Streptomyces ipomoeae TaxID=103232 RepID=UPI0015F07A4C|nr:hypothetical protein [Streptomyces ipomoeae]MDX2933992.1 hypothetical protein [Streptomyces ipomoeae]
MSAGAPAPAPHGRHSRITTGTRHRDGSRVTVRVDCPTCKGTGRTAPVADLARAGR